MAKLKISSFLQVFLFFLLFSYVFTVRPNAERVELVLLFGETGRNYRETARRFNALPTTETPTSEAYVRKLIKKFRQTFSVKDAPRSGRPREVIEDQDFEVLADFVENPRQSINQVAERQHGVSYARTQRLLRLHKFHPYHIKLIHELNEDDPDRRLEFCEEMLGLIESFPYFPELICFSDESTFSLNGDVNRHNCRYWAPKKENPHASATTHTQYPQKLNVWCGIMGDKIIGPFFIDGNLTGPKYREMLEEQVIPAIYEIAGAENFEPWFQQDGAPAHYALAVRNYLDEAFPERWIGRRGAIEWPARSPDLNPLDFFLCGHLKSVVYATPPTDLEDLRQRIIDECARITPLMLANVRAAFEQRLYYCQEKNGFQFEQEIR